MTVSEDNLGQLTQPANIIKQPSSRDNVNETTPNVPEDNLVQMTQLENVVNQSPLNLPDQTTNNLQPDHQPSSRNCDGQFIIFYQTCTNSIIFR